MTFFGIRDFFIEAAIGNIPTFSTALAFGNNPDVDTGTDEDLWGAGGDKVYLTSAETVDVVSDDANDTLAGTGARTVQIVGVDSSYNELIETVNMNGLTPVTTVGSFLRVDQATVITAGSGGINAGNITLDPTTTGSSATFGTINIGDANTRNFFYTVRNNQEVLAILITCSVFSSPGTSGARSANITLQTRESGEIFRTTTKFGVRSDGSSVFNGIIKLPKALPAQTDIKARINVENINSQITSLGQFLIHDV